MRIVDVRHRPCANPSYKGKTFGINAAAWWGFLKDVRIPVRPHFGVIGLAPKEADTVDSMPPGPFGWGVHGIVKKALLQ